MNSRFTDIPVLKEITSQVPAGYYNPIRLALLRLQPSLRLDVPLLRGLDMLLEPHNWICVDRTLDDLPVLAWSGFETATRTALHTPVRCRLRLYNPHATMLIKPVLEEVATALSARLSPTPPGKATNVRRLRVGIS